MRRGSTKKPSPLTLASAVAELPYELGQVPEISAALEPFGVVGYLESREGTEKWARYGIRVNAIARARRGDHGAVRSRPCRALA